MLFLSSGQELDRYRLRPLLALSNYHSNALTFHQFAQPSALESRNVDEYVLATAVGLDEAEPLLEIVPSNRTDTVDLPIAGLPARGSAWLKNPRRRAPDIDGAYVHLNYCADLWSLLPSADLHLTRAPAGKLLDPSAS